MPTPTLQPFYNSTMFSLALMTTRQFCFTEYKQNIIYFERTMAEKEGCGCMPGRGWADT